jgi:hypothetical protein
MVRVRAAIERFLRTGDYESGFDAWDGSWLEQATRGKSDLLGALVEAVRARAAGVELPPVTAPADSAAFTLERVAPMVQGLFPASEQPVILALLARSVVFLTHDNIEPVLRGSRWPSTAWDLANLYLDSIGAELLGPEAPRILGLSEETTAYVSLLYFHDPEPFSDFVVHETAHIFHNCKRKTVGLPESRSREWLLPIAFRKRETFAYACERFSHIVRLARTRADRRTLFARLVDECPNAAHGAAPEHLEIVREAIERRNGWKHILERCAEPRARRSGARAAAAGPGEGVPEVNRG